MLMVGFCTFGSLKTFGETIFANCQRRVSSMVNSNPKILGSNPGRAIEISNMQLCDYCYKELLAKQLRLPV